MKEAQHIKAFRVQTKLISDILKVSRWARDTDDELQKLTYELRLKDLELRLIKVSKYLKQPVA